MEALNDRPLAVVTPKDGTFTYGLVDRDVARKALFEAIYKPREKMLPWFEALADVENGDGRAMLEIAGKTDSLFRCSCGGLKSAYENNIGVETAISCSDASVVEPNVDELKVLLKKIRGNSKFGELWLTSLMCR